jgi:hypothetical protein
MKNSIKKMAVVLLFVGVFVMITGCSKTVVLEEDFLEQAHLEVKKAYGEDYLPNMPLDEGILKDVYGIPMEDVEEFIGEAPMISVHVDTFIGLKVKEGKMDGVKTALENYRKNLIENSFQYPMNMPKVNAAKVHTLEDYAFFLMLGPINDAEIQTEEEAMVFAEEGVQIAIDAIDSLVR